MQWVAIGILTFLAMGGAVGGVQMIKYPDGSGLRMSTDLLRRSPVDNYLLPGVFLLIVMTAWPIVNIFGLVVGATWAPISMIILGVVCLLWIAYQYYVIRTFSPFQPTIFVIGLALIGLGLTL